MGRQAMGLHPDGAGEFGLIARHFLRPGRPLAHAALGIGDDCALLPAPAAGWQWAVSSDMLVCGQHFFADVDPASLGHKALAVNVSDLAACGAEPVALTLSLGLPQADDAWLAGFTQGLFRLADACGCELVGGDTTRSPLLTISITVMGQVPAGQALLRSGARAGDDVWVSHPAGGGLGDARLALHAQLCQRGMPIPTTAAAEGNLSDGGGGMWLQSLSDRGMQHIVHSSRERLERPMPRQQWGQALRGVASACADVSDGLSGDIQHLLRASGLGAMLWYGPMDGEDGDIPPTVSLSASADGSPDVREAAQGSEHGGDTGEAESVGLLAATSPLLRQMGDGLAVSYALAGGDDYELLFTAPPSQRTHIRQMARAQGLGVSRIGCVQDQPGLRWRDARGIVRPWQQGAFDHFAADAG